MDKKHIYKIDMVMILGMVMGLVLLLGIIGFRTPYVISPQDGAITTNKTVLFSFENGDYVFIDENKNFTSPRKIMVKDDLVISLEPGVYYWRVEGLVRSMTRKLTVRSKIDLRMEEKDGEYALTNAGNVGLNVEIYNRTGPIQNISLARGEEGTVNGTKFIGGQDE